MPDKQPPPPLSWAIYLARSKPAKWLGTVEAADADVGIEAATKKFEVKDSRKLIAVPAAVGRFKSARDPGRHVPAGRRHALPMGRW